MQVVKHITRKPNNTNGYKEYIEEGITIKY